MIPVVDLVQAPLRGRAIGNARLSVAEIAKIGKAIGQRSAAASPPARLAATEDDIDPDLDFFVAAGRIDEALKLDRYSMEFPIFGLSVNHRVRVYERNGVTLAVKPGADGSATVHDKSVWIFAISHFMAAANAGRKTGRKVRFHALTFFEMLGRRSIGAADYDGLAASLNRLAGTRVVTNIKVGGKTISDNSGLVDSYTTVRDAAGRLQFVEISLPDWLISALRGNEVLTLSPAYFGIRRAFHRRVYELARKHCGNQTAWRISVATLHEKIGSHDEIKKTRAVLRDLIKNGELPGYTLALGDGDIVTFAKK